MRRGKLVCLVGIDGAGKTTIGRLFAETVSGQVEYRYVWCNTQAWIVHGVVALSRLLRGGSQGGDAAREAIKARRPPWLRAYYALLVADYVRHVLVAVSFRLWRGHNVIADRYAFDVAVSVGIKLGWDERQMVRTVERLLRILPEPSFLFYLDVPAQVALERKDDVPSLDFLLARQAIYERLAERYGMIRLDGTAPPARIVERMIKMIEVTDDGRS